MIWLFSIDHKTIHTHWLLFDKSLEHANRRHDIAANRWIHVFHQNWVQTKAFFLKHMNNTVANLKPIKTQFFVTVCLARCRDWLFYLVLRIVHFWTKLARFSFNWVWEWLWRAIVGCTSSVNIFLWRLYPLETCIAQDIVHVSIEITSWPNHCDKCTRQH